MERIHSEEEIPKSAQNKKVYLNKFFWVPDSCHREDGKSSRELFEKVRINVCFLVCRDFGWALGSLSIYIYIYISLSLSLSELALFCHSRRAQTQGQRRKLPMKKGPLKRSLTKGVGKF